MFLSDVGFEPTPSSEDQNSHPIPYLGTRQNLESGALDHSANLTQLELCLNLLGQKVKLLLIRARLKLVTFCVSRRRHNH